MPGAVGIFWVVDDIVIPVGCTVELAVRYGDCLTYEGGHAEHWESWQAAGGQWLRRNGLPIKILSTEYDDHPRGRVVKTPKNFVIYADRRIQKPKYLKEICGIFEISKSHVSVMSDPHYRKSL